jgi:hypothetical protein
MEPMFPMTKKYPISMLFLLAHHVKEVENVSAN